MHSLNVLTELQKLHQFQKWKNTGSTLTKIRLLLRAKLAANIFAVIFGHRINQLITVPGIHGDYWYAQRNSKQTDGRQTRNLGPNESWDAADLRSLISHSISGKQIQEIYLDENTLINTERIPLASFETLQLTTNPNPRADNHSCICVMYQPRKVHKSKVKLSVFRLYSLQGRGRTADQKTYNLSWSGNSAMNS